MVQQAIMNSDVLVYGLTRSHPPDSMQIQRQHTRLFALLVVVALGLVLAPLFLPIASFWNAWQQASWGDYWHDLFPTDFAWSYFGVFVLSYLLRGLEAYTQKREQAVRLRALRQAAATGNDSRALLVLPQPEPLAETHLPADPTPLGRFHPPADLTRHVLMAVGIVSFVLALFVGLLLGLFWISATPDPGRLITGSSMVLLVGIGALLLQRLKYLRQGIALTASRESLEWKQWHWWGSWPQRMAWQEARAFYTFAYEHKVGGPSQRQAIYTLDAPGMTFAWMLSPALSERERESHTHLARLIVTRTPLSLRNLDPGLRVLEQELQEEKRRARSKQIKDGRRNDTNWSLIPMKARLRAVWRLMAVPLVLFSLLSGVAWGMQTYESSTYGQLLVQVRTHQPIFADALTSPDGYWPVIQPTATDPGSATFINHAYQLSGSACFWVWPSLTIGNAAVEVTVHLRGGTQTLGNTWVGLVLHMDDQGNGLVFQVNPAGFWIIGTLDTFDFHESGSIQISPNKLAVIMRGNDYLFFVNDQFVGTYHDTRFPIGHVGVYLGSADTVIAFNTFAVYPL